MHGGHRTRDWQRRVFKGAFPTGPGKSLKSSKTVIRSSPQSLIDEVKKLRDCHMSYAGSTVPVTRSVAFFGTLILARFCWPNRQLIQVFGNPFNTFPHSGGNGSSEPSCGRPAEPQNEKNGPRTLKKNVKRRRNKTPHESKALLNWFISHPLHPPPQNPHHCRHHPRPRPLHHPMLPAAGMRHDLRERRG